MTKPAKRLYSLRLRLLCSVIGISTFLWLVSLAIMVSIAWHETNDVFDDALEKSAFLLLQANEHATEESTFMKRHREPKDDPDTDDIHFQLIRDNQVLSRTREAPSNPFISNFYKKKGFQDINLNGDTWRIFVLRSKFDNLEVQVGQSLKMRMEILEDLAENLAIPALSLLLLLGVTSAFAIYYLLKPLNKMAEQLAQKTPQDLNLLPLDTRSIELSAITNALNGVLSRLSNALDNERRFTADAAHELRTPLAAISMQAQLLQRQRPEMQEPLQKLRHDINRCTHLIEHLLLLARLDPLNPADQNAFTREQINLPKFFEDLQESFVYHENIDQINLVYHIETNNLYANTDMLRTLLRNLIDNAIRYCPEGSTVIVSATQTQNTVTISVKDNGKGVTPEEIKQLTQRFFRVLGSEKSGSGLGLSIVQRIADLHHAKLSMTSGDEGRGLNVSIAFPIK